MEKIKFEWHSVKDLQPYEHNARKHDTEDVEAIKRSIEQFGFNDPIGIWSDENLIVEGHGRLLAANIICNCLENFGFIALAFGGIYDVKTVLTIALSTSVIETIVALLDTPFLYIARAIHDKENMD